MKQIQGKFLQLGLYASGNLARQLAAVVTVPIYTRYLSPSDYGLIEIAAVLATASLVVGGVGLNEYILRKLSASTDVEEGRRAVSNAVVIGLSVSLLFSLALIVSASQFADWFTTGHDGELVITFYALSLVPEVIVSLGASVLRSNGRAFAYAVIGFIRLLATLILGVVLVVVLQLGPVGLAAGNLVGVAITAVVVAYMAFSRTGVDVSASHIIDVLKFGLPLTGAGVLTYYALSVDRFLLENFLGLSAVGIYGLAMRFSGAVSSIAWQPFEAVWEREQYRIWTAGNNLHVFQQAFRVLAAALLISSLLVGLFSQEIFLLLAPSSYSEAAVIAPLLTVAGLLTGLSRFCRFGSLVSGRTGNSAKSALLSAVAITLLLSIFIPLAGLVGAALAVLIAAVVRLVAEVRLASVEVSLHLPWKALTVPSCVAVTIWILSLRYMNSVGFFTAGKVGLAIAYTAWLWRSSCFTEEDRSLIVNLIRRVLPGTRRA